MGWYKFLIGSLLQIPRKCNYLWLRNAIFLKDYTRYLKATTFFGLNRYRLSFILYPSKWRRKNLANQLHFKDRLVYSPNLIDCVLLESPFCALFKNKGCCCDKQILIFTPTLLLTVQNDMVNYDVRSCLMHTDPDSSGIWWTSRKPYRQKWVW